MTTEFDAWEVRTVYLGVALMVKARWANPGHGMVWAAVEVRIRMPQRSYHRHA
jgi:hypothetical protein